jgi:hypothetical protein
MTKPWLEKFCWAGVTAVALAGALVVAGCGQAGGQMADRDTSQVVLVPRVTAGWVGWCMATSASGGCARGRSRPPIVAETWSGEGSPEVRHGYAITDSDVASVLVRGAIVATRTSLGLPDGLRTVAVTMKGNSEEALPRFIPRDADEKTVSQSSITRPIAPGVLGLEVSTRRSGNPSVDVCSVAAERRSGLVEGRGVVVLGVTSQRGLIGEGFISCASRPFALDGWPVRAGVLLSASHPGALPPRLPAMSPVSGYGGVFEAPGGEGEVMTARRVPGAWLVVTGGKLQQRLQLLKAVRVTLHLRMQSGFHGR